MPRIAYYVTSDFPQISTTFVQRELAALRALGMDIMTIGVRRPPAASWHAGDERLVRSTQYLRDLVVGRAVGALIAGLRSSPRLMLRSLVDALTTAGTAASASIVFWLAGVVLADYCRVNGVRHIHAHFAFPSAEAARWAARAGGLTYSVSIHGSDVLLNDRLNQRLLADARLVVSNCTYHLRALAQRFPALNMQAFRVVRLGLDLNDPLWCEAPAAPALPLRIVNIGRLHEVKAQHLLVRACALLRDRGVACACRIVGEGPQRLFLNTLIDQLNVRETVALTGPADESAIAGHLAWAHVKALSSISEGTPMTVIEAMARGRAVVAPAITGIPEMVEHGRTGLLFAPGSAQGLADALAFFHTDPDRIVQMGRAGRARAEELFSARSNYAQLYGLLNGVAA